MLRAALFTVAAVLVGACFINGNGQAQGDAKDNGNGNGSGNGSGNGNNNNVGSSSGSSGFVETGETPSNGAWDVTAAAGDAIGPSEFVLTGDTANGSIVKRGEGLPDPSFRWCTVTKDRNEFQLRASGNSLSGSFTITTTWDGFNCPQNQLRTVTVSGKRTAPGKNALDGTWTLTIDDGGSVDATLRVATSAGSVSATSTSSQFAFAARLR
jgi:hypothetical protein